LLILHGDNDDVVSSTHATAPETALKQAGKRHELIRYPGEGHSFENPAWRDSFEQMMRCFKAQSAAEPAKRE